MANKIIFLDVDGVLNNESWVIRCAEEDNYYPLRENGLEDRALALLAYIVRETGASVVISSSWRRISAAMQSLLQDLAKWKIPVVGETPLISGDIRGNEIQAWLDEHPEVERFVILDDDDDMGDLIPHLVQTTWKNGLQPIHKDAAIHLLNT